MKKLDELIDTKASAWPTLLTWFSSSPNTAQILPTTRDLAEKALLDLQVTTRSALGALVLESGGVFFQNSWLRFLGAGGAGMERSIIDWNRAAYGQPVGAGFLIVARDVVGGFFALNGGAWPGANGSTFYMAPDNLQWEDLELSHSQLLQWAATGDVNRFYADMRWPTWQLDVELISGDQGISFYPPLWANQEVSITERSREIVPLQEIWDLDQTMARQIKDLPDGTNISITTTDQSN